jgi:hypothetical protein
MRVVDEAARCLCRVCRGVLLSDYAALIRPTGYGLLSAARRVTPPERCHAYSLNELN